MKRTFFVVVMCFSQFAFSQSATDRAKAELDNQLKEMMGARPTKVKVQFVPLDEVNYDLVDASFELDGKSIRTPPLKDLMGLEVVSVAINDVSAGKHRVKAELVYAARASSVISDEGDHRWKIANEVSFDVASGIEVQVNVSPKRDENQKDVSKRFSLRMPSNPVMLAAVEDGYVAPPPPRKESPVVPDAGVIVMRGEVLDAGVVKTASQLKAEKAEAAAADKAAKSAAAKELLASKAAEKAEKLAQAKQAAAEKIASSKAAQDAAKESAKQKALDAAAAKQAKTDERAAALESAKQAKAQALADVAASKAAAAAALVEAEANKKATEQAAAQALLDVNTSPVAVAIVDAGIPVELAQVEIDAGTPMIEAPTNVAIAPVVAAPVAIAPVAIPEEGASGVPWYLWAAGGLGVAMILFWFARRKKE